jgi:4-amino-4-deoxy-L-arabinose transferase-like glycosyltransferase
MIVAPAAPEEEQPGLVLPPTKTFWSPLWRRIALGIVLLVSLFLNFYQLGQDGYANTYYAAAIRSMLDSWHNFFFVSFDPGGFVTVDKPPLGFWLQAASAKIFGFSPFSILLPQALAGVLAVLVLYLLVRRHFGVTAGLLAALALAISPISVVTNRNNTIDSTLVLVLLLGAWAVMRAVETGRLRWLVLCAVCIGLGFNIKMMEAYLVVPAFGLLYLLAAPKRIWIRLLHLLLAMSILLVISLSWITIVDLTPASQRPYVGSSQDNSELSLAIGYNGVERLLGSFGLGGSGNDAGQISSPTGNNQAGQPPEGFAGGQPPEGLFPGGPGAGGNGGFPGGVDGFGGGPGGGGGSAGMFDTGNPGVFRLFNEPLGGQIVWLLPLALLSILALLWQRRPLPRTDRQLQMLIVWGVWLLTVGIFFSVANFFHQYYLSTLAPAICALFGIGIVVMWQDYRKRGWRGWLLPVALLLTALEQIHIISSDPSWGTWLIPVIALGCILAAILLFIARLLPGLRFSPRVLMPVLSVALAALLLTSAVWAAVPAVENQAADLPVAGPTQAGAGGGPGETGTNTDSALITYLEAHLDGAKYLVAVASANDASSLILTTNLPVMALGGFTGSDPILTTSELASLVANGTVRFFLLGGIGGGQSTLTSWVTQHCTSVPSSNWQTGSSSTSGNPGNFGGSEALYECQASS